MMMSRYVEKKAMFCEKLAEKLSCGTVRSDDALSQSQHGTQELNDETIYEYSTFRVPHSKKKGPRSKSGNIPWAKPHV